jgi:hypothetical protein
LVSTFKISQRAVLRLVQRVGQDLGREAVDLRVELQRRHGVRGAGDLEVHVTEGVLGSEDVGQGDVVAVVVDESHRDTRDGRLDRHAGRHQRQRRATDRTHRRRTVGLHDVGDDTEV